MRPASVELHIEELVLDGFAPADRYRIAGAVQRELARLFTQQDAPPPLVHSGDVASLDGGTFQVAPGAGAETVGAQVASALFGRLTR